MLPFTVTFRPGLSVHEQVVYAVTKAIVAGQLRSGEPFPSVRAISQDLRINPNTAHKIVATLVNEGLLEVRPGIGTVVAAAPEASARERRALLEQDVEKLVVEARRLAVALDDVLEAVRAHWDGLSRGAGAGRKGGRG
jgi:GntR family transcriptional regulator